MSHDTEKEFIDYVKKTYNEKIVQDGRTGCYIAFKKDKENSERVTNRLLWIQKSELKNKSIIVHEAFHSVCEIMAYKNIHLTETNEGGYHHSSEEAWAYLLEYIYKEICKKLKTS